MVGALIAVIDIRLIPLVDANVHQQSRKYGSKTEKSHGSYQLQAHQSSERWFDLDALENSAV